MGGSVASSLNLEFPADLTTANCEHGKLKIRDVTPAV